MDIICHCIDFKNFSDLCKYVDKCIPIDNNNVEEANIYSEEYQLKCEQKIKEFDDLIKIKEKVLKEKGIIKTDEDNEDDYYYNYNKKEKNLLIEVKREIKDPYEDIHKKDIHISQIINMPDVEGNYPIHYLVKDNNKNNFKKLEILVYFHVKVNVLNSENQNLSFKKQQQIKQMLRGILLSKIRKDGVNLKDLNNFVKNINSKIRQKEEISKEEYYFTFMISDKYSKNLKIVMPIFEPLDVFYLFYKYDKNKFYKLGDIFNEVNPNLGGINDIAQTILARNDYKNMIELSNEISKLFYENICIQKYIQFYFSLEYLV